MKTRSRSSIAVQAKTAKKQKPNVTTKSTTKGVQKQNNSDDGPWYRMFTKGDEEYDQYMATEWGFEKVGHVLYL
jgi:hypothetical protein